MSTRCRSGRRHCRTSCSPTTWTAAPLTRAHGAPVRLVIPEMYGYKNVKWLSKIELVPKLVPGYWEQNGYDIDAWVGRSNGY